MSTCQQHAWSLPLRRNCVRVRTRGDREKKPTRCAPRTGKSRQLTFHKENPHSPTLPPPSLRSRPDRPGTTRNRSFQKTVTGRNGWQIRRLRKFYYRYACRACCHHADERLSNCRRRTPSEETRIGLIGDRLSTASGRSIVICRWRTKRDRK